MIYIYITLLLFLNYIYLYSKNNNIKLSNYCIIFFYILFIGFAYFNFTDTFNYFIFFKYKIHPINKNIYPLTTFEPLFVIYSMGIKYFSNNFFIYQAITFTIEFLIIHYSLKKLLPFLNNIEYIYLKIFLFFPFIMLLLPAFRQSFAVTIFIFSLLLITEKKYVFFVILNFIGILFHTSLLFCFPLYFFIFNKSLFKNIMILYILFMLGILSIFYNLSFNFLYDLLQSSFFYKYIFRYTLLNDFNIKIGFLKKIELIILFYFLLLYNYTKEFNLFKSLFLFYYIFNLFFTGIISHRILYYFDLFYYVAIFLLLYDFNNKSYNNKNVILNLSPLIYVVCIFLFKIIDIFNYDTKNYFFPYQNYFF